MAVGSYTTTTGRAIRETFDLQVLARRIAANLPFGHWRVKLPGPDQVVERFAYLVRDDGAEVELRLDADGKRIAVSGEYPYDATERHKLRPRNPALSGTDLPKIGVSITRPAAVIAGDIGRRFLPEYLTLFEACVEANKRNLARERSRNRLLNDVLAATGLHTIRDDRAKVVVFNQGVDYSGLKRRDIVVKPSSMYNDMLGRHEENVGIDLTLPTLTPAEAVEILALLRRGASEVKLTDEVDRKDGY